MIALAINDISQFSYDDQVISVVVKFRSKDLVYLEILNQQEDMHLPPQKATIFLNWQWESTLWKQAAVIERIDQGPSPLIIASTQGDPQAIENRRNRRYRLRIPVYIPQGPLKLKKIATETEDISVDGLRCLVPMSFKEDSRIDFMLQLPNRSVKISGIVIRCQPASAADIFEMAVRLSPEGHDYQRLRSYLEAQS